MKYKNDSKLSGFDKHCLSVGDFVSLQEYYQQKLTDIPHIKKYIKLVCYYEVVES